MRDVAEPDFAGLLEDVKQATSKTQPQRNLSREAIATKKVETGQVTAAMNALKSTNGLADPEDAHVQARMDAKHPIGPSIATPADLPSAAALHITVKEARKLLKSAERGKSAGPSRLTNEMVRDACLNRSEEGAAALGAFITYVNTFIDGGFDPSQAPFINAARLIAKIKTEADERPITIGEVLRRLICRYLAKKHGADGAAYLSPLQVGFAVQGGAEAVARGLNFLFHHHKRDADVANVSIDGRNAFNEVDRENMLKQVREQFPALARIAYFLYSGPAVLYFGQKGQILSLCGTHQGCPLGGLFFALAIHPLLTELKVRLSRGNGGNDLLLLAAYYDNIYVVIKNKNEKVPILLNTIDDVGATVGYSRGRSCFISAPAVPFAQEDEDAMDVDNAPVGHKALLTLPHKHGYVALGYPIGDEEYVQNWLVGNDGNGGKLAKLNHVASLVNALSDSQTKLYLTSRSVVQHAPYLARIIPKTQLQPLLARFEATLRHTVSSIAGVTNLTDPAWRQAKLPYKQSGLQIQDPVLTADAAYLGSLSSFGPLTLQILGLEPNLADGINLLQLDPLAEIIVNNYNAASGMNYDVRAFPTGLSQKDLAEPLYQREHDSLLQTLSLESKARLLSCSSLASQAIYTAVPNAFFGTKVPTHVFEKIVQFTLGNVVGSPTCSYCGHANDANGIHQTTCQKSGLAKQRHDNVTNAFSAILTTAGLVIDHEVTGMIAGSNQRPGDIVVHNFTEAGAVPFDITIVSPTCSTHVAKGQIHCDVANSADDDKRKKYKGIRVHPLSFESHGLPSRGSRWFMSRCAERMTELNFDLQLDELAVLTQRLYIAQRISVALQIGNARMLLLCGNRQAARQDEQYRPDELAPMVDFRHVSRRAILSD